MGLLDDLMGAGGLAQLSGLIEKSDGADTTLTGDEATKLHEAVAQHVSTEEYHQAATTALAQLSPEQHAALSSHLQQQAQSQGVDLAQHAGGQAPESLGGLASILTGLQKGGGSDGAGGSGGGGLMSMLGGAGGLMSNPLVSMAIGSIGAMLAKQMMSR